MDCVHFLLTLMITGPIRGTDDRHRQWLVHHCGTRHVIFILITVIGVGARA